MQTPYSDEKWKNHLIWKHGIKTLFPKQFTDKRAQNYPRILNRYYHRGSSPHRVNTPKCCDTYLEHDRRYGNTVVSKNNPYSDDNPGFADYTVFSIFGDRVLTRHDIATILQYYNTHHVIQNPERLYGPFEQRNLNIASETAYNKGSWDYGWKGYHHWNNLDIPVHPNTTYLPVLYQIAHQVALEYMKTMNRALISMRVKTFTFHLAKNKIMSLTRSKQTHYVKYVMNVALVRNTEAKMYVFEVVAYYNPNGNKLMLGKSTFIGSGTTDSILLPKGESSNIFKNDWRPLHPLHAKDVEMMSENEANDLYWQYLYGTSHYTQNMQYENDLPYWHKTRHGRAEKPLVNTGHATVSSMFPDKHPNDTKCFLRKNI